MTHAEEKLFKRDRLELKPESAERLRQSLKDVLRHAKSLEGKQLLLDFLPTKFLKAISGEIACTK